MWLFLGSGFSGGKVYSHTAGSQKTIVWLSGDTEAETSGVVNRDGRETGAYYCTFVAGKVVESWAVALFCWQGTVEKLTDGSDE